MRYLFASFGRIHEGNELMEWCTGKRKLKEPKTKIRRRADTWYTYINLGINDVYEAPKHNDEIKYIPRIPKVILPKEKHPIKRNMGLLTYWNSNKRWRRRWRWLWLCGTGRAGWAVVPCLKPTGRCDASATSQPGHYVQAAWITKQKNGRNQIGEIISWQGKFQRAEEQSVKVLKCSKKWCGRALQRPLSGNNRRAAAALWNVQKKLSSCKKSKIYNEQESTLKQELQHQNEHTTAKWSGVCGGEISD